MPIGSNRHVQGGAIQGFSFVNLKCHGATVNIGLAWPRVKRANCYQLACSNLALMAGSQMYSDPGPNRGKK